MLRRLKTAGCKICHESIAIYIYKATYSTMQIQSQQNFHFRQFCINTTSTYVYRIGGWGFTKGWGTAKLSNFPGEMAQIKALLHSKCHKTQPYPWPTSLSKVGISGKVAACPSLPVAFNRHSSIHGSLTGLRNKLHKSRPVNFQQWYYVNNYSQFIGGAVDWQ